MVTAFMTAQVVGTKGYYLRNIAIELENALPKDVKAIADDIAKRAQMHAPVLTGQLKRSIKAFPVEITPDTIRYGIGPQAMFIRQPRAEIYPIAQERGYKPHYIHKSFINPLVRRWFGGTSVNPQGFIYVSKFTPYMMPTMEETIGTAPKKIREKIRRLIRRARRR